MRRRSFLKAGGGVAAFGALAGCAGSGDGTGGGNGGDGDGGGADGGDGGATGTATDEAGGEPITIGAIEPLSGNFTPWGRAHRAGLEFGVQEVNGDGGVLGRELRLEVVDTGSDPAEADSSFRRLVEQEDAVAMTGPVSSDVGILTAGTAQELSVPNVLHMAGSNDTITPETTYTFRLGILPAATDMQAQAGLIEDAGYSSVGAIIADYGWGRSVEESMGEYFPGDVQVEVAPVGASDFSSQIRKFPKDLEMMVATGHPPGSLTITNQLYDLGYEPSVITGAGLPPGVIAGALGENAFRAFTHVHNTDVYGEEFAAVGERFADATDGQFDTHSGYGYVTATLLAAAIEEAGEAEPTAIREALVDIEFDTLFAEPISYSEHGELDGCVQIYSQLREGGPSFYSSGDYHLEEQFRTDPLPALAPEE